MNKNTDKLISNHYYHIYNRAIGDEKIFFNEKNYQYFLKKYDKYLSDYLDTFAYCLLPNHFHLLIRVKDKIDNSSLRRLNNTSIEKDGIIINPIENFISNQFRKLFISFSVSINKQENRKGSLFIKNFKRKVITKERYFSSLIFYIHYNPVHHKIINDLTSYKWSSYNSIIGFKKTKLMRDEVLNIFEGSNNFINYHKGLQDYKKVNTYLIE